MGAIYIDQGFDFAKKFILNSWKKKIDKSGITILDSKTKLQEHSLKKFKKLQLPVEFKKQQSDFIIKNNFKNNSIKKNVKKVLEKFL